MADHPFAKRRLRRLGAIHGCRLLIQLRVHAVGEVRLRVLAGLLARGSVAGDSGIVLPKMQTQVTNSVPPSFAHAHTL